MVFSNLAAFLAQTTSREAIADESGVVQGPAWKLFIDGLSSAVENDELEVAGELRRMKAATAAAASAASGSGPSVAPMHQGDRE